MGDMSPKNIDTSKIVPSPYYHRTKRPARAQGEPPEVSSLQLKYD